MRKVRLIVWLEMKSAYCGDGGVPPDRRKPYVLPSSISDRGIHVYGQPISWDETTSLAGADNGQYAPLISNIKVSDE